MSTDRTNFVAKKRAHDPIVMVTCYDYPTVQVADAELHFGCDSSLRHRCLL